jgi:hypothetical protein
MDNEISGVGISAVNNSAGVAIRVESGQDVRIRYNEIGGHQVGILLDGGTRHTVQGNKLTGQGDASIKVTAEPSSISTTGTGISTSHDIDQNEFSDSKIGVALECLETGFITNNVFKNLTSNAVKISRMQPSQGVCGGSSIISGISIFKNQFVAGVSSADSQIAFQNGYSFPINISIVGNFFSGDNREIHAVQADANGTNPNVRSLIVNQNVFVNHRKVPIKLGGALGFNISDNIFKLFGVDPTKNWDPTKNGDPTYNSGIYLIGSGAGCGGVTRAGTISGNMFGPKVAFIGSMRGWGIFTACLSPNHDIKLTGNAFAPGSARANLAGGDLIATRSVTLNSNQEKFFGSIGVTPNPIPLAQFGHALNVTKCTQFQEIQPGDDAAQKINDSLSLMHQKGGGILCISPGYYWIRQTIKMYPKTSMIGQGANRTQFFREGDFGATVEMNGEDSPQWVSGLLFRHYPDLDAALITKQLQRSVSDSTPHILVKRSTDTIIEDSWFWRLPVGIACSGCGKINIRHNYFRGVYDSKEPGIQEALAAILLENNNARGSLHAAINFNFISGVGSEKRQLDWGQGRVVSFQDASSTAYSYAHNNIGYLKGVGVSDLASGDISYNYIGGLGKTGIEVLPRSKVSELRIAGNYFDGDTEAQVAFRNSPMSTVGVVIQGNHFFAARNNLYGIKVDSFGGFKTVSNLKILGNTFIDHIANPIKIMGASGLEISNNIFESFNSLGSLVINNPTQLTSGDYGPAIFLLGDTCGYGGASHTTISANVFSGGNFQSKGDPNLFGINGVLSACFSKQQSDIKILDNTGQVRQGYFLINGDVQGN